MKRLALLLAVLGIALAPAAGAAEYCVRDIPEAAYRPFVHHRKYPPAEPRGTVEIALPSFGVTALLGSSDISFRDPTGVTYNAAKLNPGDDYGRLEDIKELEDNWLYVPGGQYHNIIHLRTNQAGRWETDKIISLREPDDDPFIRFVDWVTQFGVTMIKRDHLTALIRVSFSSARLWYVASLKRLMLLENGQEFRDGSFVPLGSAVRTYIGEIPRLKTAFLRSDDGHIYSYNGAQLTAIDGGAIAPYIARGDFIERGILTDLASHGRSFYAIRAGIYELVPKADHFQLDPVTLPAETVEPGHDNEFLFTRFLPTADGSDILVFTRGNIYRLSTLQGFYPRSIPSTQINTTGGNDPAFVPELGGIVFSTGGIYVHSDPVEHFHLLADCDAAGGLPH